jgi:hypothetical protein
MDHILPGLFNDFGYLHAGGTVARAVCASGALKQGLNQFIVQVDLSIHDLF